MHFSEDMLSNFDFLSNEQKIIFLRALIHLAKVDKHLDDDELEYITTQADVHGVAHDEIKKYADNDSEDDIINGLKIIDNRRIALELIKEMCLLSHIDGSLSDEETVFIGKCGLAMGISLEKIEQISNWIIDRIVWLEQAKIIFED